LYRKAQVALAYAYWGFKKLPGVFVFCINARITEQFRGAYVELAECSRIPGYDDPKADTVALVKNWLELEDQQRWLIIVVGADQIEFTSNPRNNQTGAIDISYLPDTNRHIADFIPRCSHVTVIITTKNKHIVSQLSGIHFVVHVGPRNSARAAEFVQAISQPESDAKSFYRGMNVVDTDRDILWVRCSVD
jgi:hypothetical protein